MKKLKLRKNVKVITTLLCFGMLVSVLPTMNVVAEDTESVNEVADDRTVTVSASDTVLYKDDSVELNVKFDGSEDTEYQWQIYIAASDLWVNISGANEESLTVTYAMAANASLDDEVSFRVNAVENDRQYISDSVTLSICDEYDTEEEAVEQSDSVSYSLKISNTFSLLPNTYNLTPTAEGANELTTNTVTVNYVFEDNTMVADSYVASVATGSSFSVDVPIPTVTGYDAYFENTIYENTIYTINIPNVTSDTTYTFVYKPAYVSYTVNFYKQNIYDDKYGDDPVLSIDIGKESLDDSTLGAFVRKTGQQVGKGLQELLTDQTGFYSLVYDYTETVAADGSTQINIYYDRMYYLMNFSLDGGYGTEPIYARYESKIENVGTPTKAGYTFKGWSLDGVTVVDLPSTMPAENTTYKAVWQANDTAKVTVVFWGENADDEEYSYIKSTQINVKPGSSFTYSEDGTLICALEEHNHSDSCYSQNFICTKEPHKHTDDCLHCNHVHDISCYYTSNSNYSLGETSKPSGNLTDDDMDGIYTYIETDWFGNTKTHYYVYIEATKKWYCAKGKYISWPDSSVQISLKCTHEHNVDCYNCGFEEHEHSIKNGCYELVCDKLEHTHTSDCYMSGAGLDSNLWTFVKSDIVIVAADGSSVVNVYYDRTEKTLTFKYKYSNRNYQSTESITAKWGSDISNQYKTIASNAGSTFWAATDSDDGPYTNYFGIMPISSATYYNRGKSGSEGTMTYWGQDLNGEYTIKLFEVTGVGGYKVTNEDRYEFKGFTYDHGTSNGSSCKDAAFYYTRNSYTLTFSDGYDTVKTESVKYEASLAGYSNFVPDVPSAYQDGSVTFGGWYLNPECTGAEYKLGTHTMPADNLLLYAKWVPVQHTVKFYLDSDSLNNNPSVIIRPSITVDHGSLVEEEIEDPKNGILTFVGWFYKDEDGNEKAFDFENMPVTKDMNVYGKWFSNTMLDYEIRYCIKNEDGSETEIAARSYGAVLAGRQKTVNAKVGDELLVDYVEGYYPVTRSHTITTNAEDIVEVDGEKRIQTYTFYYEYKEAVPYKVQYIEVDSDGKIIPKHDPSVAWPEEKVVNDNTKSVVTETYVQINKYMPDAYQKRLILVASDDPEDNVITFYYVKDTVHAIVTVTHMTQNLVGNGYSEYRVNSYRDKEIGKIISEEVLTIENYEYEKATINGNDATPTTVGDKQVISGTLTEDGMNIVIYYKLKTEDLTVNKTVFEKPEDDQSFIFNVSTSGSNQITVVIHGKDFQMNEDGTYSASAIVSDLRVGTSVTVIEDTEWSWRYELQNKIPVSLTISKGKENTASFVNTKTSDKWLTDEASKPNQFTIKNKKS